MLSPVKLWRNQKYTRELLGKSGKVVSFTVIRVPPAGFESQAPYPVVLVDLGGRLQIGQLVDVQAHQIRTGLRVRAVIRRVRQPDPEGVIPYGVKFKPVV
ncbi:MAG: Protein AcaC [Candidatus Gottesmanbacteria bacterium GW2011_GWB1_43_11]|uniref:Protein AcaC n=1 Tax=Candidatus Gottesmanbacteria bacterium GW2011_GWB1_43_11 TaxID=1618446 RepID=A0A0G1CLT5_9BACT|nr:MAG: Protein AcaC [Candidatus Gottesmanbacteria bacterium GW2011_GWA2_42_16]KKS53529.1 MAG: Protein AcaC [Candidatus Gottesmanbacteria bacterium GW2011_GWA1_42_26]KKS81203.1 MAG: Protein AcaC [Candidatus Gottesmanbacteria bacterium GW2011_GWC1_43_10]KKS86462.1 MAG: Protein AcaC [Candidatus Gottesmanbacteria bacterium GW2011_GWB1_43_11]OGG10108.1 MAG: hypothetical protein A2699_03650 [Candidatus Gottesmanbacteria bacterium RIFCSPHIGHO2_01_FULL_43_15]HCM37444.1 hypothetical protein [Patesciba